MTDPLAPHMHKSVRSVMQRGDAATERLCDLAAGARKDWTLPDWLALTAELDKCRDQLDYWLMMNT